MNLPKRLNKWLLLPALLVLLLGLPVYVIVAHLFIPGGDAWQHLIEQHIWRYSFNTFVLMAFTGLISMVIGLFLAWTVTLYEFPGHRFFGWALILPLALPTYIAAYTYAGMLNYTGDLYTLFRNVFGYDGGQYLFFNVFGMPGTIFIMSMVLYPYVYVLARSYFLQQSAVFMEVSASLGNSPVKGFFKVILPLARPALISGVILVLMEVLNDYGAVRYLGVDTFTIGVFTAWFSLGDSEAAMKLSSVLLMVIFTLIIAERFLRGGAQYDFLDAQFRPVKARKIKGAKKWLITGLCFLPLLFGFLLPVMQLISWFFESISEVWGTSFFRLVFNSFSLALVAGLFCVGLSLLLAYSCRLNKDKWMNGLTKFATMGYAIPGAVIGVGVMIPFAWMDNRINDWLISWGGSPVGLILSGSVAALLFAYIVRFLAVGYNPVESGFTRISSTLDDASRSLGKGRFSTLMKVNLPLLRGSLISGLILVFIDVLKELPLTLILRPFNFDTLATKSFEYAIDERLAESAPAALIIVGTGTIAVVLLNRFITKGKL